MKQQVNWQFAEFLWQQFGVQTMAEGRWRPFFGGADKDNDKEKDESGTYALHTLKETETIARLASGIKRFELPDEFNFVKLFQSIATDAAKDQRPLAEQAQARLSEIFENRRQYPRAAEVWRQNIKDFGPGQNNYK